MASPVLFEKPTLPPEVLEISAVRAQVTEELKELAGDGGFRVLQESPGRWLYVATLKPETLEGALHQEKRTTLRNRVESLAVFPHGVTVAAELRLLKVYSSDPRQVLAKVRHLLGLEG